MSRLLSIVLLWLAVSSCHDDAASPIMGRVNCQTQAPLLTLSWLQRITEDKSMPYVQIEEGQYQQQTVYVVSTCGLCFAGGIATIYRCDGTEICHFGTYILEPNPSCKTIYEQEIANKKLLLSRN